MDNISILLIGMLLEIFFDWPKIFYKRIKHPVVWIGYLINLLDSIFNKPKYSYNLKRLFGLFTLLVCLSINLLFFYVISYFFKDIIYIEIFYIIIVWSFICSKSLYSHIKEVEGHIKRNNLSDARVSLSHIVGRDTKSMRKNAIMRSSLESLSENTSDGIIAPIFWYFIFGLPGLIVYKTINTLDSMIGYKSIKYLGFGFASAKIDDFFNFFPSRLTGLIFVILSNKPISTLKIMIRDASKTDSPNAGWPEAAFAGALSIRLGGPKVYSGVKSNEQWLNNNFKDPDEKRLSDGIKLYKKLVISIIFFLLILTLFE